MTNLSLGVKPVMRYHLTHREWQTETSEVVNEIPVTLLVNGEEYVTAALTPIDVADWTYGILAGDGVITNSEDITIFQWHADEGQVWVRVPGYRRTANNARYLGSCCGQSRPGFFNPTNIPPLSATLRLKTDALQKSFEELASWSSSQHSGGLHVAALHYQDSLHLARADVGRHNALDKVFGAGLRTREVPFNEAVVLFSGRLSAEIVFKVRRMGCQAVASNAAPTSLGIELAEKLGITAIGFLRDDELSVFSHPERLTLPPLQVP